MINSRFKIILFVGILFCFTSLHASVERPFMLRGVRALGMGGAHVALSDDQNAFFYNPSGITKRKKKMLSLFQIRLGISDDMIPFYEWVRDNKDAIKDFESQTQEVKQQLLDDILNKVSSYRNRVILSAHIPPMVNYISGPKGKDDNKFWGIGVFNQVDLNFKLNSGISIPNLDINGNADVAAMYMYARKLPWYDLSAGVNIKYIYRASVNETRLNLLTLEGVMDEITFQPGHGLGADLGFSWQADDSINVGLQMTDIAGTKIKYAKVEENKTQDDGSVKTVIKDEYTGLINTRINVGMTYKPLKKIVRILFMPDVTFGLDFRDITDRSGDGSLTTAEMFKNIHTGAEFAWKFVSLRTGLNSGYPSFGVGAYLWSFKFDYAYYTDELGMFPGDIPETNHMIAITWRFGTTLSKKNL